MDNREGKYENDNINTYGITLEYAELVFILNVDIFNICALSDLKTNI